MAKKIKIKKKTLKIVAIAVLLITVFFLIPKPVKNETSNSNNITENNVPESSVPKIGKKAPDATFTTIDGKEKKLSDYRGEKVMLWYFATWCPSCIKGAEVLEKNNDKLKNMKIIALKTFGNAGFFGPDILEFSRRYSPKTLGYDNWVWGNASKESTTTYNPQNYPDIYFLVDEQGILRYVDGAPAATINKLVNFSQG